MLVQDFQYRRQQYREKRKLERLKKQEERQGNNQNNQNRQNCQEKPQVTACSRYQPEQVQKIKFVYILGILIWITLLFFLDLCNLGLVGWIIVLLPILLFITAYWWADTLTVEIEQEVFGSNYLAIGLILTVPLFIALRQGFQGDVTQFIFILVLALAFALLAMIDVWVPLKYLSIGKHSKSIIQVYAITLLILALYIFYTSSKNTFLA